MQAFSKRRLTRRDRFTLFFVCLFITLATSHRCQADASSALAGFAGPCGNIKANCDCNMALVNAPKIKSVTQMSVVMTEGNYAPTASPNVKLTSVNPSAGGGSSVGISSFAFNPNDITVTQGTTVTWTNTDPFGHTVTSDSPGWDSGNLFNGNTFQFTFNTPGDFTYHCAIHPFMTGVVRVTAVPEPSVLSALVVLGLCTLRKRRPVN